MLNCEQFNELKPEDRFKFPRENKLRDNCLLPGHVAFTCKKKAVCSVPGCGRKYSQFVHVQRRRGLVNEHNLAGRAANENVAKRHSEAAENGYIGAKIGRL